MQKLADPASIAIDVAVRHGWSGCVDPTSPPRQPGHPDLLKKAVRAGPLWPKWRRRRGKLLAAPRCRARCFPFLPDNVGNYLWM